MINYSENGIVLFVLLLALFSLNSCSDQEVDHENFVNAYVDLRIVQDTLSSDSTNFAEIKSQILKRHGITEEKYESVFRYFNDNPDQWEQFYNEAIARVDSLKNRKK